MQKTLLLILFVFKLGILCAQKPVMQFKHLTADEGLSSSSVLCILQDHKGFMWIGTNMGLNRYDGFNFVIYKHNPADSNSISSDYLHTLYEDSNKNLLIGTNNGLCLYNREKDKFFDYFLAKSSPLKGLTCQIRKITENSIGNLWLATDIGLIYFDRMNNKIIQYTHDSNNPGSISQNEVEYVYIDKWNRIWVTTRGGLNLFQPETGTFQHITQSEVKADNLLNTFFIGITEDREENLWFGSTEGLFCLKNNAENKITPLIHYQHNAQDKNSLSNNRIKSLFIDDTGNLWIGTENGGLNLFDRKNQRFWCYRIDEYNPKSLNNESISAIYQDKAGNLWVCTSTGGLNIVMKHSDAIIEYKTLPGAPFSLSHNVITCFLEDHLGQKWVGTDGGLNLFNDETNRFLRFNMDNSSLSSNAILCILEDPNNQIWLGTWAGGLVRFDSKTKSFASFTTKNSDIQDNNIFTIAEGNNNDLWLGSFEKGLIHYQIKENKFANYTPNNSGLKNKMIVIIKKDSKGRLFLGSTNCLQIFSPASDHFMTYEHDPNNTNSLSHSTISDILIENDSCVWIGTQDGLNRFNPETGSFIRYYEKDGLPDNFIKGLVLDKSGLLWVATNIGICRFNYRQGNFKNFTKADGLQSNEFNFRSSLRTKSGALLIGGIKGFNVIFPEKIGENLNIPQVVITDIHIFNVPVKIGIEGSPLKKQISETEEITLSYKQSVLTFYFDVMDFTAPEKNQYAYKMEGFDKDWTYSGNKREATYTNLFPGEYTLRVIGSNNDGVWNEKGVSLKITILPPWWKTIWFRVLAILIGIGSILAFYFNRINSLQNQKLLLEKAVKERTKEVEDKNEELSQQATVMTEANLLLKERQLTIEKQSNVLKLQTEEVNKVNEHLKTLNTTKDKFFSIIAHDLKNPFTSILGFSELLNTNFEKITEDKKRRYASVIYESSSTVFNLLENLLQWSRSQTNRLKFEPAELDVRQIIVENISLVKEMLRHKNISVIIKNDQTIKLGADKNMLNTIMRNLLTNAIKFSKQESEISIDYIIKEGYVEVSIKDSGIGMSEKEMEGLFKIESGSSRQGTEGETGTGLGLLLCKEYVDKHKGKIWVESELGKGSKFYFTLPYQK